MAVQLLLSGSPCLGLGHISSSRACFERREQFRRSVFFFVTTYINNLISVGGHKKHRPTFCFWNISVFVAPIARFSQKRPTEICSFLSFWSPIAVGLKGASLISNTGSVVIQY